VGKKELKLKTENLLDLLKILHQRYGQQLGQELFSGGDIKKVNPAYTIVINDRPVDLQNMKKIKLKNHDSLHFIPPIVGG